MWHYAERPCKGRSLFLQGGRPVSGLGNQLDVRQ
jgi:hypothetical protein